MPHTFNSLLPRRQNWSFHTFFCQLLATRSSVAPKLSGDSEGHSPTPLALGYGDIKIWVAEQPIDHRFGDLDMN